MNKLRGILWLAAGIAVALLAGLVAFRTLSRVTDAPAGEALTSPKREAVVAVAGASVRTVLDEEDVTVRRVQVDALPEGAVTSVEEAVGKITLTDLRPGEVILQDRLLDPNAVFGDGRLAVFMTDEQVLIALPAQDLLSRVHILRPGDRVDLLFSLPVPVDRIPGDDDVDEEQMTFGLLQNVTIVALTSSQIGASSGSLSKVKGDESGEDTPLVDADTILLLLKPQDALVLKYAMDAGGVIDLALRAPDAEQEYDLEPVDVDYLINRYDMPNEVGR
jgi:pilus assembly protein CpaB